MADVRANKNAQHGPGEFAVLRVNLLGRKRDSKLESLKNQGLSVEFANLLKILEGQRGYACTYVMCVSRTCVSMWGALLRTDPFNTTN